MSNPQPSSAAKRLAMCAIRCVMRANVADEITDKILGVSVNDIASALDDAGVAEAVDKLERISLSMACSDLKSWSHLIDEALAALTGESDG